MRRLLLSLVVCSLITFALGCGEKQASRGSGWIDFENFTPVGTWSIEDNQFVFNEDGTYTRVVTGPNPNSFSWEGEWRKEGGIIHTKITAGVKNDIGQTVDFAIAGPDTMRVRGWGIFERQK